MIMNNLWQDMRYAARMLIKQRGFTIVAILTLALGIGANAAIFSVTNALFLRPIRASNADSVVRLYGGKAESGDFDVFSYPNYTDLRDRAQSLTDLAAHNYTSVSLNSHGQPESLEGELVTGNYFSVLGIEAVRGRTLLPSDDLNPGAHPFVVISNRLWQRRFGADSGVLGAKIYINSHPFTVVGVMPEGFNGSYDAFTSEFWAPMMMHEQVRPRGLSLDRRGWGWLSATGRLKEGTSIEQAQAELEQLAAQLREDHPRFNQDQYFQLVAAGALPEQFRADLLKAVGLVMLIVTLVLLVACSNIASITLSRVMMRRREIAIRQSLGATSGRIARQWLVESLLLALAGGLVGVLIAAWVKDGLATMRPPDWTNYSPDPSLDARVIGFTLLLSLITGVVFGLIPAIRAARMDLGATLKEESATSAGNRRQSRFFSLFVVTQVTISIVLMVVAGLLLRSLRESSAFDPGFNTENIFLAGIDLRRHGYDEERGRDFYLRLNERMKLLPQVEASSFALVTPLGSGRESLGFRIEGHEPPQGRSTFPIAYNLVGPDYFNVMEIPILRGRSFDQRDSQKNASPTIVINETMARRFWPDQDPTGRMIQMGRQSLEIVGVARDIKYYSLGEEPQPYVYASLAQGYSPGLTLHLRTTGNPTALAVAVRQEVASLDPNIALLNEMTFEELRKVSLFPTRALAAIVTLFGLLALALTILGIYGVVSNSVARCTHEIGLRMALGAQRKDIYRLVLGQGITLTLIGVGLGVLTSLALTRFLSSLLFGVSATDPITISVMSLLLILVAMAACLVPARRAAKVDPTSALRYE